MFAMIHHLRGLLVELLPQRLVIEAGGVGYAVEIPLGAFDLGYEPGQELRVLIHHHQTEAGQALYGFASAEQRDLFRLLIERVSGVGPKVALAVLGGLSLEDFRRCVVHGDAKALARVKGLGLKTAERILLELKDKVGLDQTWASSPTATGSFPEPLRTTMLALLALGYKQASADAAARAALAESPAGDESVLLRLALRALR